MDKKTLVISVSAITDFVINAGTALGAAMVATGKTEMPSGAVILLCTLGGLVSAARTIQQAIRKLLEAENMQP